MFKHINMKTPLPPSLPAAWLPLSRVFTALGDEHRQRILLLFEPGTPLNAGQIAAASTLARPTVSHHLKRLVDAQILVRSRRGREVLFRINTGVLRNALHAVLDYLESHPD